MKDFDIQEYLALENKVSENGIESLTPEEYEVLISVRKKDTEKALEGVDNEPIYYISDSGGASMKLQENEFDSIEVVLLDGEKFTIEEFFQKFSGEGLSLLGVRIILKSLVKFDLWDKDNNYETKLLGDEYVVLSDYKIAELTSITKSIIYKK